MYSNWLIDAAYNYSLITGDYAFGDDFIEKLDKYYTEWEKKHGLPDGSFWSEDNYDAMEYSVSGTDEKLKVLQGVRPTLNSYMCADALALSRFASVYGDKETAEKYLEKHEYLKNFINEKLFEDGFYRAYHYTKKEDPTKAVIKKGTSPRELIGYIPFMFGIPVKGAEKCFDLLLSDKHFYNGYGLTTVEQCNPRFMYKVKHECLWNGYIWPFATSQTLTALMNTAKNTDDEKYKEMFASLLSQYARMHKRTKEDGTTVSWIDEVMSPVDGDWSSRTLLKKWGWNPLKGGYERGKDYNHSTFCDLVISGLCGVGVKDGEISVNPVIPDSWDYFSLKGVRVLGKEYNINYDRQNGLAVTEK